MPFFRCFWLSLLPALLWSIYLLESCKKKNTRHSKHVVVPPDLLCQFYVKLFSSGFETSSFKSFRMCRKPVWPPSWRRGCIVIPPKWPPLRSSKVKSIMTPSEPQCETRSGKPFFKKVDDLTENFPLKWRLTYLKSLKKSGKKIQKKSLYFYFKIYVWFLAKFEFYCF